MKKFGLLVVLMFSSIAAIDHLVMHQHQGVSAEPAQTTFVTTVDPSQPLTPRITAGHFDRIHPGITAKNFPTQTNGPVTLKVVLISLPAQRMTSTDDALRMIDSQGCRPATLDELVAFGTRYRGELKRNSIVAIGSSWKSSPSFTDYPSLDDVDGKIWLWTWFRTSTMKWPPHVRFLAVQK